MDWECDKNIKVLLVEDMKIAQKLATIALNELNCLVDVACSGTQALEYARKNLYDLILMDLGLPDIDGITVAETIRKLENYDHSIPIVALTAHGDSSYRVNCLESGMDAYLVKPLTKESGITLLQQFVYPRRQKN